MFKKNSIKNAALSIIFLFCANVPVTNAAETFEPASHVKESLDLFTFYPGAERNMGRSGVVLVSLMVDERGNTFAPMIEASNNHRFNEAALKAIKKAKYLPATSNGKPIQSATKFQLNFTPYSGSSRNKLFFKHHKTFQTLMSSAEPDQKKALILIEKMSNTRHGYEYLQSMLSEAKYRYAKQFSGTEKQISALREMMLSGVLRGTKINNNPVQFELLRLLIDAGRYGEANSIYFSTAMSLNEPFLSRLGASFSKSMREIRTILKGQHAYKRIIKISESGYSFLTLSKPSFTLTDTKGELEKLVLRCSKNYAEYAYIADTDYTIPEAWGECQLQLVGAPQSTANLIQL